MRGERGLNSQVEDLKLSDFLASLVEKYGDGLSRKDIVVEAAALLKRFTYKDLLRFLYDHKIFIKQETVKRIIRKLKEEGYIEECGTWKKQKVWCVTAKTELP